MGGDSSKHKISAASSTRGSTVTVSTINTIIDEESGLSEGKRQKKDKKKSKSKDKVKLKVKDEKGKKTKQRKGELCKSHARVSFEGNDAGGCGGGGGGALQPYRKKSACPSCDTRDMLLGQIRSRSGSLRYSDFNKVMRQSRINDLDDSPMEVFLDGVPDPLPDTVCFICGVYTGSVTRSCRVCCHVYHNGCLHKIRQSMDQQAIQLAQMDLWSCHQCSDVSRLLTREETQHTFNNMEGLDVDPDCITVNGYIMYKEKMCSLLGRSVTAEKKLAWISRFKFVAGDKESGGGVGENANLDWGQFLQAETISILRSRCKESLVKLMTEMEFAQARKMYRGMSQNGDDVKMAQVKNRILEMYMKFGIKLWPEDQEDAANLDEEDFDKTVTWNDFLCLLAIHMITVRENNKQIPSTNHDVDFVDSSSNNNNNNQNEDDDNLETTSPSLDSIDDEDYRTCESDLNSSITEVATVSQKKKPGHKKNLSDVQLLDDSDDANKSLSILDDLSRAFNLDRKLSDIQRPYDNQQGDSNNSFKENNTLLEEPSAEIQSPKTTTEHNTQLEDSSTASAEIQSPITTKNAPHKIHLWQNPTNIRDNPNFTMSIDVPESKVSARLVKSQIELEKSPVIITKRRSEVLVRPSTEEGRSPRRALSQKLVAPAYGLVDKVHSQDWQC